MTVRIKGLARAFLLASALAVPPLAPAQAQYAAPTQARPAAVLIAIPPLATPEIVDTPVGDTWTIANGIADLITSDLKSTDRFIIADASKVRLPSFPEVTAPAFPQWRAAGTKLLLSGFVQARSNGRLMVGCYVYDVQKGTELTRKGFLVTPTEWRRAAHRCADAAYSEITGNRGYFDSRIAYVAQSGRGPTLKKRIAVMDLDGTSHSYVTTGESTVVTPSWSPDGKRVAYTSIDKGHVRVRISDIDSPADRPLLPGGDTSFAPAFSPEGDRIAFSMAVAGNTDIYSTNSSGFGLRRITSAPGIDTGASFSPDGRRIVFSSDRSGSQQLYVMESDGGGVHRISFGPGEYGDASWSPDGKLIAFTNVDAGRMRIGTISVNGTDLHIVTDGPADEQPTWAPDSEHLIFQRHNQATGRTLLYMVRPDGREARQVATPQDGSDPEWMGTQQ